MAPAGGPTHPHRPGASQKEYATRHPRGKGEVYVQEYTGMAETTETNVINPDVLSAAPVDWRSKRYATEKPTVVIAKDQVITRQGKEFVLYAGLLDAAHRAGMQSIYTNLVQAPTSLNGGICICHATVEFPWGSYTGIGDADDQNVGKMIVIHKIRMAETRAKARALRDALNVGMAAVEELGDTTSEAAAESEPPARNVGGPGERWTGGAGGSGAAPRPVAPTPPDRAHTPAPATPSRTPGVTREAALEKFTRVKTTALRLRDQKKLVLEDALIAPFTEDATAADIEAASQRLLARINTSVQRPAGPNGNGGSGK